MKLRAEQLGASLERQLAPVYVVSGDEPFQVDEACERIRAAAGAQGFGDRQVFHAERGFDWQQLLSAADSLSLFAERKLLELRLPTAKPGTDGARVLQQLAESRAEDQILLLVTAKLDATQQRSKWFKALEGAGVVVQVWPLDQNRLPQWIRRRMQMRELQPSGEALSLLADRVEGNLLAADQELEKLRLLYGAGPIDADQVQSAVTDSARFDVFQLVDAALAGQRERSVRILYGLCEEGVDPVLVLWALARELRQLARMAESVAAGSALGAVMGEFRVWERRKRPVAAALQRLATADVGALLCRAHRVDRVIKGRAAGRPWDELLELVCGLAGGPLPGPAGQSKIQAGR